MLAAFHAIIFFKHKIIILMICIFQSEGFFNNALDTTTVDLGEDDLKKSEKA
jgi:hypothetical protein